MSGKSRCPRPVRRVHAGRWMLGLLTWLTLSFGLAPHADAFYVTGHVQNTAMVGVSGVAVEAVNVDTGLSVSGFSATDGGYEIFVPPGTYDIAFVAPAGEALVSQRLRGVEVMDQVVQDVVLTAGYFIFGTLRNPALLPVANVDVDVLDPVTQEKIFTPNDETDAAGFFAVVVPPGTYDLVFEPPPATALPAVLDPGVVVTSDVFHDRDLAAGVLVSGTVVDPDDNPLAGVDIDASLVGTAVQVPVAGDLTDADGHYQIALFPGHYDLEFSATDPIGFESNTVAGVMLTTNTTLDVHLTFPFRLSGFVSDAVFLPVPNVKIKVFEAVTRRSIPLADNLTDANGEYRVDVPGGTLEVHFLSPEGNGLASLPVRNLTVIDDTELTAVLPAGLTLTGSVTDPQGFGVVGVDLDFEEPATGLDYPVFDDDTDATGQYTAVLPAGTYNLSIDPGPGVPLVAEYHTSITVPATSMFDAQLDAGVFVSGQILDLGSNPWAGIDVDVRIPAGGPEIETPRDNTDATGHYQVVVPVGTYDFVFTPPAGIPVQGTSLTNVPVSTSMTLDAFLPSTVIAVGGSEAPAPLPFELESVRPNPFNPSTRITFHLDHATSVSLTVYDVAGHLVRRLLDERREAGAHSLTWDGRDDATRVASSGVYFLRLEAAGGVQTQKMVLAR